MEHEIAPFMQRKSIKTIPENTLSRTHTQGRGGERRKSFSSPQTRCHLSVSPSLSLDVYKICKHVTNVLCHWKAYFFPFIGKIVPVGGKGHATKI